MTIDYVIQRIQNDGGFATVAECDEAVRVIQEAAKDSARLSYLESEAKREPLLIHNCVPHEMPAKPRGIGLLPWNPRTLREALDQMMERSL